MYSVNTSCKLKLASKTLSFKANWRAVTVNAPSDSTTTITEAAKLRWQSFQQ
jgi:hypothetical protein